ncbi:MAG: hypothetical protein ACOZAN_04875 [Patescibacteria group bacterium]
MKKNLIIGVVALVVLLGIGGTVVALRSKKTGNANTEPTPVQKKKIVEPTNVIEVGDRPYLRIYPAADGRNVEIEVVSLKKNATTVEYELEYQAGSLLQGAFGQIELGSLPAKKTILLGSCSAGGACTYHEDVRGGSLVTRYDGGDERYALKSDWKYIDNRAKETEFSSKDAKFQISSKEMAKTRYLIIFNNSGYPEGLKGTPVSDVYTLETSTALTGKANLTMRANEEGSLSIMGYDGKDWKKFEGKVEGKMVTAEVDLMESYVVVK